MTKTIFLKSLARTPETDPSDTLHFERGVNVIVGKPNTGKSQWMRMLDYLMGDVDKPSDAFDSTLAEKYETIKGVFEINGEQVVLERRWKERGNQGKVYVNGVPLVVQDAVFSDHWLELLDMPRVSYPTGDPYRPGAWRRLTWRSLLRQVYRKQDSWTEIASQQPPGEQHACLMLFTGLAEALFSTEYGDLVELQKQITRIANKKEQFLDMLNELSHELLSHAEAGLEVTPEAIQVAREALDTLEATLKKLREEVIQAVVAATEEETSAGEVERLSAKYEELQELRASLLASEREHRERQAELEDYRRKLDDEIAKFGRAKGARSIFEGLHVTQCPACQRAVQRRESTDGECYVCHQSGPKTPRELETSKQRVEFELEQLNMEVSETNQLIAAVVEKADALIKETRRTDEELRRIFAELQPVRKAVAAVLPPEVSLVDMELGRLLERRTQLNRVAVALDSQEKVAETIAALEKRAAKLDAQVQYQRVAIDFNEAAEELAASMNQYLGALNQDGQERWDLGRVDVVFRERGFAIFVNGGPWRSNLGGTNQIYLLLAYNYALMKLTHQPNRHYPGFAMLDFPPQTVEGEKIADKENFMMDPFVGLLDEASYQDCQVIATGVKFQGLEGAHRIELSKVWGRKQ